MRRPALHRLPSRAALLWAALGVIAGLATGALLHLETRTRGAAVGATVYHGRYMPTPGVAMSRAYESTLTITLAPRHSDHWLLIGLVTGLLTGLTLGIALTVLAARRGRRLPA